MFNTHQVRGNAHKILDEMSWGDLFRLCFLIIASCAMAEIRSYLHTSPPKQVRRKASNLIKTDSTQW